MWGVARLYGVAHYRKATVFGEPLKVGYEVQPHELQIAVAGGEQWCVCHRGVVCKER